MDFDQIQMENYASLILIFTRQYLCCEYDLETFKEKIIRITNSYVEDDHDRNEIIKTLHSTLPSNNFLSDMVHQSSS